jgi:lactoylglutathione lyase
LVFLKYPNGEAHEPLLELTHNWDIDQYDRGNAYGHVAYQVDSIESIQSRLKQNGFDLSWGPGTTPSGKRKMAFVDDPDGYEIELLEEIK